MLTCCHCTLLPIKSNDYVVRSAFRLAGGPVGGDDGYVGFRCVRSQ
jgi:hypothetical protein